METTKIVSLCQSLIYFVEIARKNNIKTRSLESIVQIWTVIMYLFRQEVLKCNFYYKNGAAAE